MRYLKFFILIVVIVICKHGFSNNSYASSIYIDKKIDPEETTLRDFLSLMKKHGSGNLMTKPTEEGINFVHISNLSEDIGEISDQDFYIQSDQNKVIIVCSGKDSFQRAAYYLLKQLGYYFLWHSDNWTIVPDQLATIQISGNVIKPKINSIAYFGTGGTHPYLYQTEMVNQYQRRNFWGVGDYSPVGHSMAHFYKTYEKEVKKLHEQGYTIYNDLKSKNPKDWNFDEPKTIELITEHFRSIMEKNPNRKFIDVSPPDGIGNSETLPKTIPEVTNVGEKHWWWIKQVALMVQKSYPNTIVKVNAYGNGKFHAKRPSFDLPDNLMVQIVPDAFQRSYRNRKEMYNDWSQVSDKIFYRGYINITQWSKGGLPQLNIDRDIKKMSQEIADMELAGVSMESTYFLVMAPHLYVLSNLWTGYSDKTIDQLYDEWFQVAFPESSESMRSITMRWGEDDFLGEAELPFLLRDLNNAYEQTNGEEEKARIREYMIYAHYLVLYYQAKSNPGPHTAKTVEDYAKYMNQTGVLQTKAVYAYDYGNIKPYGYGGWDRYHGKGKSQWKSGINNQRSKSEIKKRVLSEFYSDLQNYPIQFSKTELNIQSKRMIPKHVSSLLQKHSLYQGKMKMQFMPEEAMNINFQTSEHNLFKVTENGKVIIEDKMKKLNLKVSPNILYEFEVSSNGVLDIQSSKPVAIRYLNQTAHNGNGWNRNSWYLWVPENADEIVWKGTTIKRNQSKNPREYFKIQDSSGTWKRLDFQKRIGNNTFKTPTRTKQYDIRGTCIQIHTWVDDWDIINFEKVISKQPFEYTTK